VWGSYLGSAPPGKAVSLAAVSCCCRSLAGLCRPLFSPSFLGSRGVSSSAGTPAILIHDTIKALAISDKTEEVKNYEHSCNSCKAAGGGGRGQEKSN